MEVGGLPKVKGAPALQTPQGSSLELVPFAGVVRPARASSSTTPPAQSSGAASYVLPQGGPVDKSMTQQYTRKDEVLFPDGRSMKVRNWCTTFRYYFPLKDLPPIIGDPSPAICLYIARHWQQIPSTDAIPHDCLTTGLQEGLRAWRFLPMDVSSVPIDESLTKELLRRSPLRLGIKNEFLLRMDDHRGWENLAAEWTGHRFWIIERGRRCLCVVAGPLYNVVIWPFDPMPPGLDANARVMHFFKSRSYDLTPLGWSLPTKRAGQNTATMGFVLKALSDPDAWEYIRTGRARGFDPQDYREMHSRLMYTCLEVEAVWRHQLLIGF